MKNTYIAVQTEDKNGKFCAYAIKVNSSDNLVAKLKNLSAACICETKKEADWIVNFWNDCFKSNGTYMFDDAPMF